MVDGEQNDGGLFPMQVGERLRAAREAAVLNLDDIGSKTRVPIRHLEAIERNDYAALPSATYAVGFVKAYARALGLDEHAFAHDLRSEIGRIQPGARETTEYEPADPSRVPTRLLAWTALVVVVLFVGGYFLWRSQYFGESAPAPTEVAAPESMPTAATTATPAPAAAPNVSASGQVVLTATAAVWLRITDSSKKALFEKEMAAGERYELPRDAADPRILTGRPDAIKVTVDGRDVPPLGEPERTIRDVAISAAALAARPPENAAAAGAPAPAKQ